MSSTSSFYTIINDVWDSANHALKMVISMVHTHSATTGQGGQLDWDNIWSDAVHSHQSDAEGGTLDHGLALTGLTDDDHTIYQKESLLTTAGDTPYATAASTWARLPIGTAGQNLKVNAGATAPTWSSSPSSTNRKAMAHPNANQAIVTSTYTKVTLDVEDYDPGANFATNTYTVAEAGYYLIIGSTYISAVADAKPMRTLIYKNGAAVSQSTIMASASADLGVQASAILSLAVSDTIELYTYHNHGSDRNTSAADCFLSIHMLSA